MIMAFCPNCNMQVGFKRHFGIGTIILCIITFGWWLLALPFYPKRCIRCGLKYSDAKINLPTNFKSTL